jgi:acyl-CoA dehydrogenase
MSEPDSGSDLASIRTRAVRADGGYVVNGTKVWTSNAHLTDYAIALFRTSVVQDKKHEGLSQFLVDLKSEGIGIRPIIDLAGGHHFNEVHFQNAFVPDDMRGATATAGSRSRRAGLRAERRSGISRASRSSPS